MFKTRTLSSRPAFSNAFAFIFASLIFTTSHADWKDRFRDKPYDGSGEEGKAILTDQPDPCVPGPNRAVFFEEPNYGGRCFNSSKGWVEILGTGNREWSGVSSVQVGPDMQVVLCSGERFKGNCILTSTNIRSLGNTAVGDNSLTSFYVREPVVCMPTGNLAAVFSGVAFSGGCVILNPDEYPTDTEFDMHNGIASILQQMPGDDGGIRLCTRKNFKGKCETITVEADASLQDNKVGIGTTSSIKVLPLPPKCSGSIDTLEANALPTQFVTATASYSNCDNHDKVTLTIWESKYFGLVEDKVAEDIRPEEDETELSPSDTTLAATYNCGTGNYQIRLYAKLRTRKGGNAKDLAKTDSVVVSCGVPDFN